MANTLVVAGQVGEGYVTLPPEQNKPWCLGVYLEARPIPLKTTETKMQPWSLHA